MYNINYFNLWFIYVKHYVKPFTAIVLCKIS